MPYLPGAATASEALTLLAEGYTLQKFFPAEYNGGVKALKALSEPLPELRLLSHRRDQRVDRQSIS